MNMKFGRKISATEIEYAPDAIVIPGSGICFNPDAGAYLANNPPYRLIVQNPPTPRAEHYMAPVGWEETETQLVRTYEEREIVHTVEDYNVAMEDKLREERTARGYDTREPSLYINSSIPRWKSDAQDWIAHIDAVMVYAQTEMAKWEAGGTPPTIAKFIEDMPKISWTEKDAEE